MKPIHRMAAAGRYVWRHVDIRKPESWLNSFVNLILRIGVLLLIIMVVLLVWRIFKDKGYSIEAISMPEQLEKNGFNGLVVAGFLQDAYLQVKSEATSVKADSISTSGGEEQPELNVAVMGFGLSPRSLATQLRQLMGRRSNLVRGAITTADSTMSMTLRMTGNKPVIIHESLHGGDIVAMQRLLRRAGEQILGITDPYRLAIYLNRKKRFEESLQVLRRMIQERPAEKHWAYLAWGDNYENQGQMEDAVEKYKAALAEKSDFPLPMIRLAWVYSRQQRKTEALEMYKRGVETDGTNPSYWNGYANALAQAGQVEASEQAFERMAALTKGESGWLLNWAEAKANRGDLDGAKNTLRKAIAESRTEVEKGLAEALLALFENDSIRSYNALMRVVELDPNQPFAVGFAMNANYSLKKYEKAILLGTAFVAPPGNNEQHQRILNITAMAYNAVGQHANALLTARKSVSIGPNTGYPYTTLAETYAFMGQTQQFYDTLEVAFKKGFGVQGISPEEEPYRRFAGTRRYRELIAKYKAGE